MKSAAVSFLVGLGCLIGCGPRDTGPTRYRLSGSVTFEGEPVQNGTVVLIPKDGKYGGGSAPIANGRFDTAAPGGRGHLGGPHSVVVNSDMPAEYDEKWVPAFPPYKFKQELPALSSTLDIEVPAAIPRKRGR